MLGVCLLFTQKFLRILKHQAAVLQICTDSDYNIGFQWNDINVVWEIQNFYVNPANQIPKTTQQRVK